ncbi:MAG: UPF0158 family protein [Candidatus Marinimicrobia bacterium]|nr:UPF0158 family protein [Candidatus Neomarinimicrobiota bacterium]
MSKKVKISDLLFGLEGNDLFSSYVDKKTGKVHTIPKDTFDTLYSSHSSGSDVGEFEGDIELAKKIEKDKNEERYVPLPSEYDINEWEIMRDFCYSLEDEEKTQELLNAIHGRGAFRYFKDMVFKMGIRDDWFKFRDRVMLQKVIKWCERNDIDYINDK